MSFVDKIWSFIEEIVDKIRVFIFYLGLHLIPPIRLLGLIYAMGLVIWYISLSVGEAIFKIPLAILVAISFLFLAYGIYLAFPPAKRVKIIADAYGNNPRIIPFIAKKS